MDNTREKLIELLCKVQYQGNAVHGYQDKYIQNSELADHLIANGVTLATDNNVGDKLSPTNADRIRAMSDEELAENLCDKRVTKETWLKWLKQPVGDE